MSVWRKGKRWSWWLKFFGQKGLNLSKNIFDPIAWEKSHFYGITLIYTDIDMFPINDTVCFPISFTNAKFEFRAHCLPVAFEINWLTFNHFSNRTHLLMLWVHFPDEMMRSVVWRVDHNKADKREIRKARQNESHNNITRWSWWCFSWVVSWWFINQL